MASATIIQTVAYLDSTGYFSGQAGVAALGGTTPWEIYLQVAIASSFGALDGSSTAAQTQCMAMFEIVLGRTNGFTPVVEADIGKGIYDHRYPQCIPLRSRALVILVIVPPRSLRPPAELDCTPNTLRASRSMGVRVSCKARLRRQRAGSWVLRGKSPRCARGEGAPGPSAGRAVLFKTFKNIKFNAHRHALSAPLQQAREAHGRMWILWRNTSSLNPSPSSGCAPAPT